MVDQYLQEWVLMENISPTGNPIDVLNPLGQDAGRRLRTVKDAEALRDAQNIVFQQSGSCRAS